MKINTGQTSPFQKEYWEPFKWVKINIFVAPTQAKPKFAYVFIHWLFSLDPNNFKKKIGKQAITAPLSHRIYCNRT